MGVPPHGTSGANKKKCSDREHESLILFGFGLQQLFLRCYGGRGLWRFGDEADRFASRNAHMRLCYKDFVGFLEYDGIQRRYFFKYKKLKRCLIRNTDAHKALGAIKFAVYFFGVPMVHKQLLQSAPHRNNGVLFYDIFCDLKREFLFKKIFEESGDLLSIPPDFFAVSFGHTNGRRHRSQGAVLPAAMDPLCQPEKPPERFDPTGVWKDMWGTTV